METPMWCLEFRVRKVRLGAWAPESLQASIAIKKMVFEAKAGRFLLGMTCCRDRITGPDARVKEALNKTLSV